MKAEAFLSIAGSATHRPLSSSLGHIRRILGGSSHAVLSPFRLFFDLKIPKKEGFLPLLFPPILLMNWFSNSGSYLVWFLWVAIEKHKPPQLNLYLGFNPFGVMIIELRVYLERSELLISTCTVTIERNNMWVQAHYCGPLFLNLTHAGFLGCSINVQLFWCFLSLSSKEFLDFAFFELLFWAIWPICTE